MKYTQLGKLGVMLGYFILLTKRENYLFLRLRVSSIY